MKSPFPASTAAPGHGRIVVARGPIGMSVLEDVAYQYPLKLIAPSATATISSADDDDSDDNNGNPRRDHGVLVFLLSYGGGLVAGDQVLLSVDVRAGARLSIVTQGTTKVFKAPTSAIQGTTTTRQTLNMHVAPGAALCLLPDPVQPFADSVYEQRQIVRLAAPDPSQPEPSLCLLDWVTQGRAARGENWSLARWSSRNEVWAADRLIVRDAVLLDRYDLASSSDPSSDPSTLLAQTMHGLAIFGTLILRGPLVDTLGRFFLAEFAALPRLGARGFGSSSARQDNVHPDTHPDIAWRNHRLHSLELPYGVLWSAAAVRGCVVVKFGARSVEGARLWIGSMLVHDGSIAAVFGPDALMCVR